MLSSEKPKQNTMIDTKLQKSIRHFEAQFQNWQTLDKNLPFLMQEAVAEPCVTVETKL
jgi:hypothetical protein